MTLLERRAELAKAILNDMDEDTLNELELVYSSRLSGKTPPCQYTPEEIRASALEALKQIEEGKGISHEDMKNRHRV